MCDFVLKKKKVNQLHYITEAFNYHTNRGELGTSSLACCRLSISFFDAGIFTTGAVVASVIFFSAKVSKICPDSGDAGFLGSALP